MSFRETERHLSPSDSHSTCKNTSIEYTCIDIVGEGCKLNNYWIYQVFFGNVDIITMINNNIIVSLQQVKYQILTRVFLTLAKRNLTMAMMINSWETRKIKLGWLR